MSSAIPAPLRSTARRIVPRVRALAESPEMGAIQKELPRSFVGLVVALVAFMASGTGTLLQRFTTQFAAAFGVMSVVLLVLLTLDLAPRRGVPRALALAIAAAAFAWSLPYRLASGFQPLAKTTGSSGLFLAIGLALLAVSLLAALRRRLGVVAGSVASAVAVIGVAAALQLAGISLTAILDVIIAPLASLGDSLGALLIIVLAETLLWTIGIHGPALLAAILLPIYVNLQLANTAAVAHHLPAPHIVTVSTFLFVFPGGAGATLPLVLLLLRAKAKRVKRIALATVLPSLANVNEPLMFGLPLVLNPILSVPFVVTPLVLAVTTYVAMATGLVAKPDYYIISPIPMPLNAYLASYDWRAVALMLANIAIGLAIYAPFVGIYDRRECAAAAE